MSVTPARGARSLEDDELLALARKLPEPSLNEARREEMRTAFLSAVRELNDGGHVRPIVVARKRRLPVIGAVVLAAAGAAAAWQVHRPEPAKPQPFTREAGDTSGGRSVAKAVLVAPAAPARAPERSVTAAARPRKLALVHRGGGEQVPGSEVGLAFTRGWSALRDGDFSIAADAFARAATATDNALAEDALFWQGVALDRAGRFGAADRMLADFLLRYPRSDRRGEASVILGWLLVRSGERGEARARFEAALGDPAERVRNSARAGLTAAAGQLR